VARYRVAASDAVTHALCDPANETPKPGQSVFAGASFALATRPAEVFRHAEAAVRKAGYDCVLLGTQVEGGRVRSPPSMPGWPARSRRKVAVSSSCRAAS